MGVDTQMLVRVKPPLSPQVVRRLAVDLAEAYGHDRFWIWKPGEFGGEEKGRHCLEIVQEYEQDGDTIYPENGEQFIEAHLATRYYGEGYERGNLPFIISVAEWLEVRIPGCSVWYGGDSSGICAEPFDHEARRKLFLYFCKVGHKPYHGGFGTWKEGLAVVCDFCQTKMSNYGGSRLYNFLACDGCGQKVIQRIDNNEVFALERNEDFFAGSNRLRDKLESPA